MQASMARLLALNIGAYYQVMNGGSSRKSIFLENKDRERFLDLLGETSRQWERVLDSDGQPLPLPHC